MCICFDREKGGARECFYFNQMSLLPKLIMNSAAQLEIHGFPMNEPFSKKQGPVVLPKLSKQRTSS